MLPYYGDRMSVNKEIEQIKIELSGFKASVESWMLTTTEYRQSLCHKIDDILIRLNDLPCKERKGWYASFGRQLNFMWVILSGMILAIIADFFRNR